jgi:hypothetical protein
MFLPESFAPGKNYSEKKPHPQQTICSGRLIVWGEYKRRDKFIMRKKS